MFNIDPDCPEDVCFMEAEEDDVLVVEVGGGPPAPGGRGGRVRVLLPEVTLSVVTEFLQLISLSVFVYKSIFCTTKIIIAHYHHSV